MYQDFFKNRHYVKFSLTGLSDEHYFEILKRERFVYDTGSHAEFSSIATGATTGNIDITFLEPGENELYHIFPGIKDGCTYYFRIPAGNDTFGVALDKDIGYVDNILSPYYHPNAEYSFFTAIKTHFTVNAHNDTGSAVTPMIRFRGMKYKILRIKEERTEEGKEMSIFEKLQKNKLPYTSITLGGFAGQ